MTEELKKEGMELIEKLNLDLDYFEYNLEQLANLGCDCHNFTLIHDSIRIGKRIHKIRSILEFYKCPIAWNDHELY